MSDAVNQANSFEAVTNSFNLNILRKCLLVPTEAGETNFEVVSVRAVKELVNGHNTEVAIKVDLGATSEGALINESERYSYRTETVRRIDLREVAEFAGLEKDENGSFVATITDVETAATALKANLSEDDVYLVEVGERVALVAKANSVGYIGRITFVGGEDGGEVTPEPPVLPISISLDGNVADLSIGDTVNLTVEVLPADAEDKTFTITSSNESVITVSGTVATVVGYGQANLVATTTAGSIASSPVAVSVVEPLPLAVTARLTAGASFTSPAITAMDVGTAYNLILRVANLTNATTAEIAVSSPDILIDVNSPVQLTTNGDMIVPVTVIERGTLNTLTLTVTVNGLESAISIANIAIRPTYVPLTGFTVTLVDTIAHVGNKSQVTVTPIPANASNAAFNLTTSDGAVLTVAGSEATAVGVGTAKVIATSTTTPSIKGETADVTITELAEP